MWAGGYYYYLISRILRKSHQLPIAYSGELNFKVGCILDSTRYYKPLEARLYLKCCRSLVFPRGICHAHGSHKQAENGTSIVSVTYRSPMMPDAMHLLTCVKITSDILASEST